MALTVDITSAAGWEIVVPAGPVDAATASALRSALESAASAGPRVLVDLGGVSFLDSTGLGVLVGALRRVKVAGGSLRVVCADSRMLELFRVTGLYAVLDVRRDLGEALRDPIPGQRLDPDLGDHQPSAQG